MHSLSALGSIPRAGSGFSPIGASFDAIYNRGLYADSGFPRAFADIHSLTRASAKYASNAAGVFSLFASGVPAITDRGILIEESRTNLVRNNSMQGAIVGSPGSSPNNWFRTGNTPGFSSEILGFGSVNGIDYIDIRMVGDGTVAPRISADSEIPFVGGQTYTHSCFLQKLAGSNINFTLRNIDLLPASIIGSTTTISPTSELLRYSNVRASSAGTTLGRIDIVPENGASPFDVSIRIGWPQVELGAFPTSPIRTTNAASTRAADVITIPSAFASLTQGSVYNEREDTAGPATSNRVIFNNYIDNNNVNYHLVQTNDKDVLIINTGGVLQTALTSVNSVVAGALYKVAYRYGQDDIAIARTTSLSPSIQTDTGSTMPTGAASIRVGGFGGSAFLNGYLRRLTLYPRKLTDAELGALVA